MSDWIAIELESLFVERPKSKVQVASSKPTGLFPFFTSGENSYYLDEFMVEGENIFLATGGIANVKYFNGKASYSSDTFTITSNKKSVSKHLYYCILKDINIINTKYFLGSGLRHLQKGDFKKHKILIPTDLKEQSFIVDVLTTIDNVIEKKKQIITKYERIKTGLMQALFTYGIDEEGNIRNDESHEFKDSPLGRIPVEWEVQELQTLVEPDSPIVYGILMPGYGYPDGIPVIKVKDIIDEKVTTEGLLLTSPQIALAYERSKLAPGDLLFTIRGTVGRCAFVPESLNGANITQDTARIRIRGINSKFIRYYFKMPLSESYIKLHTIGLAVKGINLRDLRKLLVVVPSKQESDTIAFRMEAIEKVIESQFQDLYKLRAIKIGLMQELITGKVRVNALLNQTTEIV